MSLRKETLQPLTVDDQVAFVADDEMFALELDEEFGYPRTRSAHQVSKVLVSRRYRQACAALVFDAEILAELKQNQRETLLQRATHEVRAAQLDQVPPAEIADGHPFEVFRGDPQRDFDERLQVNSSDLTGGNRFAAEVIADHAHRGGRTGTQP